MFPLAALAPFAALAFFSHPTEAGTPVRATLDDGQLLVGDVYTENLVLVTGQGPVEIPLGDVGEVVPAKGDDLDVSNGNVSVWLRNGTELIGRWADPHLEMGISIGSQRATVDLPMDTLRRFQTMAGEQWPAGELFRVRTTWGDDFLIDPAKTQLVLDSNLGQFPVSLADCVSAQPVDLPTGDWQVELHTGTVLKGQLVDAQVRFALPMGPESITVPLEHFASLERQLWNPITPAYSINTHTTGAIVDDDLVDFETTETLPSLPRHTYDDSVSMRRAKKDSQVSSAAPAPAQAADTWFDLGQLRSERESKYEE